MFSFSFLACVFLPPLIFVLTLLLKKGPKPNIHVTSHSLLFPRLRHLPFGNCFCFKSAIPRLEHSFRGLAIQQGYTTFRRPIVATF